MVRQRMKTAPRAMGKKLLAGSPWTRVQVVRAGSIVRAPRAKLTRPSPCSRQRDVGFNGTSPWASLCLSACPPFSSIFNCPIVIFAPIGTFAATVSTVNNINEGKHPLISCDNLYTFILRSGTILHPSLLSFYLNQIPVIRTNNLYLWIWFFRENPFRTI